MSTNFQKTVALKKIEVARHFGISRQAVTAWFKPGARLERCLLDSGMIDVGHAEFVRFAAEKGLGHVFPPLETQLTGRPKRVVELEQIEPKPLKKLVKTVKKQNKKSSNMAVESREHVDVAPVLKPIELPAELMELEDMTLGTIVEKYGGLPQLKDGVAAYKLVGEAVNRRLEIAKKEGELLPKEIVEKYLFSFLQECNSRLLGELPQSLSIQLRDHYDAGETVESAEDIIKNKIGKILKFTRDRILRDLEG